MTLHIEKEYFVYTICPLLRCCFGSWEVFKWLFPLWRGGHCIEVKIRVNVWNFCQDKKVAISCISVLTELHKMSDICFSNVLFNGPWCINCVLNAACFDSFS